MEMARTKKLYQNDTLSKIGTVSQNGKRSRLVSLIPSKPQPITIDYIIIELLTARKTAKLKPIELELLILVHSSKGITIVELDSLKLFSHHITITRALDELIKQGLIIRDNQLLYHGTTTGNYLLRSILPSFTFPLPRF